MKERNLSQRGEEKASNQSQTLLKFKDIYLDNKEFETVKIDVVTKNKNVNDI